MITREESKRRQVEASYNVFMHWMDAQKEASAIELARDMLEASNAAAWHPLDEPAAECGVILVRNPDGFSGWRYEVESAALCSKHTYGSIPQASG